MTTLATINAARNLLTPAQFAAWELSINGNGTRRIALLLDITRGSVTSRLDNAEVKLIKHGFTQDGSGNWHERTPHED